MAEDQIVRKMIDMLEANGDIRLKNNFKDIIIQSIDNKEGYSYISSNNKEFKDSDSAVHWAINQIGGLDKIDVLQSGLVKNSTY